MSDDQTGTGGSLCFHPPAKVYLTIRADGSVEIPADVSLDEATAAFWAHMEKHGPKQRIERLLTLLEDVRPWVSARLDCPAWELIERIDAELKDR